MDIVPRENHDQDQPALSSLSENTVAMESRITIWYNCTRNKTAHPMICLSIKQWLKRRLFPESYDVLPSSASHQEPVDGPKRAERGDVGVVLWREQFQEVEEVAVLRFKTVLRKPEVLEFNTQLRTKLN
ncbi:hypothetical protein N1851_017550 [Merluccius polli]|uniref:Enhancer of polycomb C-terminal domain-containing protein n=1 Tax=Merluccius polli TaxID=89951 RepID=A0AA47MQ42_MERPO|nr:hypothetical protein N1851_017550 [Merluccius polli]